MTLNAPDRELLERIRKAGSIASDDLVGGDLIRANRLVRRELLIRAYRDRFRFEVGRGGLAALEDFGRVAKAGRVYCLNPRCGCTADAAKFSEWVCGKCWRLIPKDLAAAYRELRALQKRMARRRAERPDGIVEVPLSAVGLKRRMEANWSTIRDVFLAPEKPEGLDTFLSEMGWNAAAMEAASC